MIDKLNEERKSLFSGDDKVLGVLIRGTDYNAVTAKGHPIPPAVYEALKKCDDLMQERGYTKLFLVTEDIEILKAFQREFEDRLSYVEQFRWEKQYGKSNADIINETKISTRELNEKYILAVYLLAECPCIVASMTSAVNLLPLIREMPFEYTYIFDKGRF